MPKADLGLLKREVARLERGSSPMAGAHFSTGVEDLDRSLGGGLARGAMHEVFAQGMLDEAAAAMFVIGLALRASDTKPVLWVRQDFVGLELGEVYAPGLAHLGLSPERLILVRARDGPSVLRAGEEAARCPPLGAVIIEPWGNPKALDLVASRRLMLAAGRSGEPLFMLRAGGANYNLDIKNPHSPDAIVHDTDELLADYAALQVRIGETRNQLRAVLAEALENGK